MEEIPYNFSSDDYGFRGFSETFQEGNVSPRQQRCDYGCYEEVHRHWIHFQIVRAGVLSGNISILFEISLFSLFWLSESENKMLIGKKRKINHF